ncbi:MAG: lipid IV(A) 3-deoxy-D-manno-octulosonic acid transferase [Methylophilaceae bacterium]
MSRILYTLLLYLLLPFVPLKLLWRGLRQPEYLHHWAERFGYFPRRSVTPLIWMHCVSVGETRAAAPLVEALQQRYPQYCILLTHATPTGRATSEQLFGKRVERAYLPYDVPGAVQRFLCHFQPQLGLLMETELWFNLIAACKQRDIPLLLVNARMSEKSARGYARVARLSAQGLQKLDAIAAQSEADARRLRKLGAERVEVSGNLKFDISPPRNALGQGLRLRELIGIKRPVFLAASTREGEEVIILDALQALNIPDLVTIVVPRHPQRFDEVAKLLKQCGIDYVRRSHLQINANENESRVKNASIILGDSMGEMFVYYAACDIAFIGGSLLPLGGQNLIEACIMGKPVLVGPHTFNFTQATEQALRAGAALCVKDGVELATTLQHLINDPVTCLAMHQAALAFSHSATGATERVMSLIARHLPTESVN